MSPFLNSSDQRITFIFSFDLFHQTRAQIPIQSQLSKIRDSKARATRNIRCCIPSIQPDRRPTGALFVHQTIHPLQHSPQAGEKRRSMVHMTFSHTRNSRVYKAESTNRTIQIAPSTTSTNIDTVSSMPVYNCLSSSPQTESDLAPCPRLRE